MTGQRHAGKSPKDAQMEDTDRAWERYGKTEPYLGVLNDPKFSGAERPGLTRDAFFDTGERHVDHVFELIRKHDSAFTPTRVLDFGCGVGRLTIPFAKRAREVIGVDVSDSMRKEAANNAAQAHLDNIQLLPSEPNDWPDSIDLIHSLIVFQHIPPERGLWLVQKLVNKLTANGWGALQFVYQIEAPLWWRAMYYARWHIPMAHNIANVLQGAPLRRPFMQMNVYPQTALKNLLGENNCVVLEEERTHDGKFVGSMLVFKKQ